MVRDPQTGKYRRTRLFVLTLGCSRKSVRLLVFRSSARVWAELHEKAFRRLGGATRVVVLDNLREGMLNPDIYDPSLNPLYRDVLKHYGAVGRGNEAPKLFWCLHRSAIQGSDQACPEARVVSAILCPTRGESRSTAQMAFPDFNVPWTRHFCNPRGGPTAKPSLGALLVGFSSGTPVPEPLA